MRGTEAALAEDALPETQSELRWRPGCHTGVVGLQRMMRPVSEACLSWIFLYCLAGQAAIKSPLSAVRLKCKEVDAAAHFAALSRGANALPPPQPGVSAGVPACNGSCCGVKRASLPFIRHMSIWGWAGGLVASCLFSLSQSALADICCCAGTKRSHMATSRPSCTPRQRSGLARLAHIQTAPTRAHAAAANCACTFMEGRGAPVPKLVRLTALTCAVPWFPNTVTAPPTLYTSLL